MWLVYEKQKAKKILLTYYFLTDDAYATIPLLSGDGSF
jgi:hypothetical protein